MLFAKRLIEYVYDFHYRQSIGAASSAVNDVPLIMVIYMHSEPNLIDFSSTTMAVMARMTKRFSPPMCRFYFLSKSF